MTSKRSRNQIGDAVLPILPYSDGKAYFLKASPSTIEALWDEDMGCPRYVFYSKILGLPQPERNSSRTGVDVHHAIESLMKKEKPQQGSRIVAIAEHALGTVEDPFDGGWEVEAKFDEPASLDPEVPYHCRVDLHRPEDFLIRDWKTTRSKTFYHAKSSAELSENGQLLGNAYCIFKDVKPEIITVEHGNIYVGPGRPKVNVVPAVVTWAQVEDYWHDTIVPAAETLGHLYKACVDPGRPPNILGAERAPYGHESACTNRYGKPCPYTSICSACPSSRSKTPLPNMENVLK